MTRLLIRLFVFVAVLLGGAGVGFANCGSTHGWKNCSERTGCLYATTTQGEKLIWGKLDSLATKEAKRRGLSCGDATSAMNSGSKLHSTFNKLSQYHRQTIQSKLASEGYYKSTIDASTAKSLMLH